MAVKTERERERERVDVQRPNSSVQRTTVQTDDGNKVPRGCELTTLSSNT